jgi:alpha-amylase
MMLAYSRGSSGFVFLNGSADPFEGNVATGLVAGTYCQVLQDLTSEKGCDATVVVNADGTAEVTVPAQDALVLHKGAML